MSPFHPELKVVLINHGLKNGAAPPAHFYLDCRGLPDAVATKLNGQTNVEWVRGQIHVPSYFRVIADFIARTPQRRRDKPNPWAEPLTICFLCAFGMHRSMAMKHIIAEELKAKGVQVTVK